MNVITERYSLYEGDCISTMRGFPDNSFDTCVTDPPYGLGKQPDMMEVLRHWMNGDDYQTTGGGFMGKSWDSFVPGPATWKEVYRVLKPGGLCLVFAGTRTYDLMGLSLRLAGFELRDTLMWLYGSGMPKALNISAAIDAHLGAEREMVRSPITAHSTAGKGISNELDERPWLTQARQNGYHEHAGPTPVTDAAKEFSGWYSGLKPAWEPIIVAMKPLTSTFSANALEWKCAGLNIDECRISTDEPIAAHHGTNGAAGKTLGNRNEYVLGTSGTIFQTQGRWPANLILDRPAAALLDEMSGELTSHGGGKILNNSKTIGKNGIYNKGWGDKIPDQRFNGDTGGASRYFTVLPDSEPRFFYSSKASRGEREEGLDGLPEHDKANQYGDRLNSATKVRTDEQSTNGVDRGAARNHHPTVKNLELMKWLCRLSKTPTGGIVFDPFMGSGTTGIAAILEGRRFVGVEKEADYFEIAKHRMEHWQDEASTAPRKLRGKDSDLSGMPLFADIGDIYHDH